MALLDRLAENSLACRSSTPLRSKATKVTVMLDYVLPSGSCSPLVAQTSQIASIQQKHKEKQ
jgi:hypothetical protein